MPTAGPTADPPRQGTVADLADLLAAYPGTLVLSGAGLSTESGIPDYRGPDGKPVATPVREPLRDQDILPH
ncbi:MAG TPA: NAD-dependent deacetylase, partial [Phycicoccus sp.]|nr:NAD-dependent deacetylase [Phycicoccus sp.]